MKAITLTAGLLLAAPALAGGGGKRAPKAAPPPSDARIGRAMRAHASAMRQCYEQQLAQNPRLEGKVMVTFVAEPDGSVSAARVEDEETTLKSEELHRCLLTQVASWRLPRHQGEGVVVTLPVVFTQADRERP